MARAKLVSAQDPSQLLLAADILRRGGLVAFPTETVYGLGADALNAAAVCRIFEVKKRPTFDPLIVHVSGVEQAKKLWNIFPDVVQVLTEKFWPGPLTLVLPKSSLVPDIVTAGLPTVGIRMPAHETALALIKELGSPIAAPSANIFGYTSPTTAHAVLEDLGDKIDLVLDGDRPKVGVESTVLGFDAEEGVLLRPGGVALEDLEKILKVRRASAEENGSPGLLDSHYAPWTPLVVAAAPYEGIFKKNVRRVGLLAFQDKKQPSGFETMEVLSPKGDLSEAAANLFHAIRKLDKMNLDLIVAEPVPEKGIGLAIMDRLKRAAHQKGKNDSQ